MKFNKWTLRLAALGVVSLASAAQAVDTVNPVETAVAQTTISGYVDTSAQWNFGTGNANNPPFNYNEGKADGFNLNVVQLSIAKALDESQWASGYRVDLWMGPDAVSLATGIGGNDVAIRQAYVQTRVPVGNGLDLKLGVFDTVVGYESLSSGSNPHYTHSYGFTIEPSTHTGLLATYQFCEAFGASFGVANTVGPMINERAFGANYGPGTSPYYAGNKAESFKTYMGSLSLVAPQSMGFLAGSSLYGGIVSGFNSAAANNTSSYYLGSTIATPVTGLKFGVAYDYLNITQNTQDIWTLAFYGSMQVTEKLTFLARAEHANNMMTSDATNPRHDLFAVTATAQYDLWQNVISRLEFRWDHSEHGDAFGGTETGVPGLENSFMLAGQLIYQF